MSTILKALKKAQEGMARNTLPGKILASDSTRSFEDMHTHARRRAVALLSLLAIAVGVVYYIYYMRPHERKAAVAATDVSRPALVPTAATVKQVSERKNVAPPPLHLSGILWDDVKPIAILNGKPLTVGGEIHGASVVKIGLDGVNVRYNGREYTLTVE